MESLAGRNLFRRLGILCLVSFTILLLKAGLEGFFLKVERLPAVPAPPSYNGVRSTVLACLPSLSVSWEKEAGGAEDEAEIRGLWLCTHLDLILCKTSFTYYICKKI